MSKGLRISTMMALSAAVMALVLSACSSPTPAATDTPEPEVTEAATPTEAATEAATPTEAATEAPTATEAATATEAMTEAATAAAGADAVTVSDQKLGSDSSLMIDKVMASADGWIVIHADASGKPGTVLGYAAVKKGENDNVKVTLTDTADLAGTEWAMLHVDAGTIGTYEFPGADGPVKDASGNVVMMSFKVTK